jgi:3-deoxy-manno-octulosonate cytidylyltransferase (CMP-KDO synthetase)
MRILGVIPARYASTRFPGKPLVVIDGKTMIQRVYEQAKKCSLLESVYVATDDQSIFNHVKTFGGSVMMTGIHHRSGTERCHEVAARLTEEGRVYDAVVNVQGDEPFIDPEQIGQVAASLNQGMAEICTLIRKITTSESLTNPNVVKVVAGRDGKALYFSRSVIPFTRGQEAGEWLHAATYYEHVGIYGYTSGALNRIIGLAPAPLESAESLEQLRWLENGMDILTQVTEYDSISVDTPMDLLKITNRT